MIIAVNINKTFGSLPIKEAIEKAWILNPLNAENHSYIVGVVNGAAHGYFRINAIAANPATNRVTFDITPCNNVEWQKINNALANQNLSRFTVRYI